MLKLNEILVAFVGIYLLQLVVSVWMEKLNTRHIEEQGAKVPHVLDGFMDEATVSRAVAYAADGSRLAVVRKIFTELVLLGLILSGCPDLVDRLFAAWSPGFVSSGLCFFVALGAFLFVVGLPFDYYHTFVIEEKYGFNRTTPRTWWLDGAKVGSISLILAVVLLAPILWAIDFVPRFWWLLAFVTVGVVEFSMVILYPWVIAPLFNEFKPLEDAALATGVESLLKKVGLKTQAILQMDAGKRTSHSNAYVTGFGKTRRIVLFDTLLSSHPSEEILGVLAHELGHAKLRHVAKGFLLSLGVAFVGFYATHLMMNWEPLYATFGFSRSSSYLALFVIVVFWQRAGYFWRPLSMGLSRRFEREADSYAVSVQGDPIPLATALKRLAAKNLAGLNPHPWYVWFNYSHPPVLERIARLESGNGPRPATHGRS